MLGGIRASALAQCGEVGEREHVLRGERRRPSRAARRPRRATPTASECSRTYCDVAGRARARRSGAPTAPTSASAKSKSAHSRLVRARMRERIALADPEREEPVRELVDRLAASAQVTPAPLAVDLVRGRPGRGARRRPRPATDSRSSGRRPLRRNLDGRARNAAGEGEIQTVPRIEFPCRCAQPGTDQSASVSSTSPSGSRRRRSPLPGSPTSRSGCCTASAARRSSRSAGAPCTSATSSPTSSCKGWEVAEGPVRDRSRTPISRRSSSTTRRARSRSAASSASRRSTRSTSTAPTSSSRPAPRRSAGRTCCCSRR